MKEVLLQIKENNPYINLEIDGLNLTLLLDTGATYTYLKDFLADKINKGNEVFKEEVVTGFGHKKDDVPAYNINTSIGDMICMFIPIGTFDELEEKYGIQFDGFLGFDFLEKHNAVIDIGNYRLILKDRRMLFNFAGS